MTRNDDLLWTYRPYIPNEFLKRKNSETGTIIYSNAELTAIDLVQYEHLIGGLLEEAEQADMIHNQLVNYAPNYTYQFLSRRLPHIKNDCNRRWKIYVNTQIEPDDI